MRPDENCGGLIGLRSKKRSILSETYRDALACSGRMDMPDVRELLEQPIRVLQELVDCVDVELGNRKRG